MKTATKKGLRFLSATAFFLCATVHTQPARAVDALDLKVSRVGDVNLSCGELSQEAVLMRDIILTTEEIKEESEFQNKGITAAGAIGSFLVGSATGGIGIAAAGFLLKEATDGKSEAADTVQDIAAQRRSLMMGIYNAKGCAGPIDHAMQSFVPQTKTKHSASDEHYAAAIEPSSGPYRSRRYQQVHEGGNYLYNE